MLITVFKQDRITQTIVAQTVRMELFPSDLPMSQIQDLFISELDEAKYSFPKQFLISERP